MFENNIEFEFDDNLEITTATTAPMKRLPSISPPESNKRAKTSPKLPKNVIKRKFPGPAGILPERKDFNFSLVQPPHKSDSDDVPCSQTSLTIFQGDPWLQMCQDCDSLVEMYNIKWIKNKASLNQLPNQKAPFLAAVVHSIDCFSEKNPTVKVVLKDPSGEIQGTIIHNLYEEHSSDLVSGAVVVLKQFGVLTTGMNNNHHLTITRKNLATIYFKKNDRRCVTTVKLQEISSEDVGSASKPLKEKRVEFQKSKVEVNCSQMVITTNEEDTELWQNALDGVDADSFFGEF